MNLAQLNEFIGGLSTLAERMPPAPVIIGALSRLVRDAVVAEAKRRGPSLDYLANMNGAGYSEEQARAIFDFVWDAHV